MGDVIISTHCCIMEMLKYCALESGEPSYENYKALGGVDYGEKCIRNFCNMFAVDLDIPREQRHVIEMQQVATKSEAHTYL